MASAEAAADDLSAHMSKALHDFLAAEEVEDDDRAAPDANGDDDDDAGDGLELGEVDISTGGGASLAGLEQQLDRLSEHPVLRAILDQVGAARTDAVPGADPGALHRESPSSVSLLHGVALDFAGRQVLHPCVSSKESEAGWRCGAGALGQSVTTGYRSEHKPRMQCLEVTL